MADQIEESSALRVLVAVDRSAISVDAAVLAHALFGEDAEYTVLSVAKGDAAAMRDSDDVLPKTIPFDMVAAIERGEAQVTATQVAATTVGGSARVVGLVSHRPGKLICRVAKDMQADFIVIGSPSGGRWRQLIVRSVSMYIVRNAPCPVIVATPFRKLNVQALFSAPLLVRLNWVFG